VWHVLPKRGAAIVKALLKDCADLGVQVLYNTGAMKILVDKRGAVTGVLAQTKEKEISITAGSVIIATGGYGGNRELLKKYSPFYTESLKCGGLPHMGDGILMAWKAGAASEGLGSMIGGGPCLPGMKGLAGRTESLFLTAVAEEPNVVWVNKKGERFVDECLTFNIFESVNPLLRQPDMVTYSLFDERVKRGIIEEGIIRGIGIYFLPPRTKILELDKMLKKGVDNGTIKIANTWDEIAAWMRIAPEILKATIEEYNACCDKGYDDVFAKDRRYLQALRKPPYYAILGYPFFTTTIGGIKINHHMEVLNRQDTPIPGFYAAGVDTGGWVSDTYCGHLAGSGFGFALNSGRIAGENATRYALVNR
jgi:fumarate reductase flavoprotein subunit